MAKALISKEITVLSRDGRDLNGLKLAFNQTVLRRHVSYAHGRKGRRFL